MEKISSGIGVGIITYNRPEYYKKVLDSIPRHMIDTLVVVNDGENTYTNDNDAHLVIQHNKKLGVSASKNHALHFLVEKFNCEHLFLIEDDIIIKRDDVFEEYIKAANSTGIHHLCYEKVNGNEKSLKFKYEQPDGVKLGFYHNPQGAFMYINSQIIKKLGKFDESYVNAFEHVDFAYNLIKNRVLTPFWYFPDILDSEKYLTEIEGSSENSTITNKSQYRYNWEKSAKHFVEKWGHFTNEISDLGVQYLQDEIKFLQTHYSRKKTLNKNQKLTVIIPYRDRETALKQIIPFLIGYIRRQVENFEILVIEQDDNEPFNKGKLNNIGYKLKSNDSTYVCFHDVDLIPEFSDYSYPVIPTHLSSHCSQFLYVNIGDKIMGGVILFRNEHFEKVNGFSNEYIGWGKEDDDLYLRCERENLTPYKHPLGRYYSIPHKRRVEDEKELHQKNGEKYSDFFNCKNGLDIHKNEGLNTIPKFHVNETINISQNIKHYKIKYG